MADVVQSGGFTIPSGAQARAALVGGMSQAVIIGANQAKLLTPVDSGRLRASITGTVREEGNTVVGVIGSAVFYAVPIEYGTGSMGDPEVPHVARHWPPAAALDRWASRHGFASGAQVARIIGKRGGLLPRRMFRTALYNPLFANTIAHLVGRAAEVMLGASDG